jgi:hypothetical protein
VSLCNVCCQFFCWDCGFESGFKHGCLSFACIVSSLAGIAGSNPAGNMDVSLLRVLSVRLRGLGVRIPLETWMSVSCVYCVLLVSLLGLRFKSRWKYGCLLCVVSSFAGIASSNPAESMDVCLLCVVSSLAGIVGSKRYNFRKKMLLNLKCVL